MSSRVGANWTERDGETDGFHAPSVFFFFGVVFFTINVAGYKVLWNLDALQSAVRVLDRFGHEQSWFLICLFFLAFLAALTEHVIDVVESVCG